MSGIPETGRHIVEVLQMTLRPEYRESAWEVDQTYRTTWENEVPADVESGWTLRVTRTSGKGKHTGEWLIPSGTLADLKTADALVDLVLFAADKAWMKADGRLPEAPTRTAWERVLKDDN